MPSRPVLAGDSITIAGKQVITDVAGRSSMRPKWAFGGGKKSMSDSRVFFAFTALAILIPALPCDGQTVSMNPSKLSFSYTPGGPNPPSQSVSVSSSGAAVDFVVRVLAPAANWLAVNPARGT